jgi:hypothetical protein
MGRGDSSYSFLTSELDGVSGQRHALAALYPRERTPGTHWIGGWVGLRAGVFTEAIEKSLASVRDRTLVVQSVVRHYTDCAAPAPSKLCGLYIVGIVKYGIQRKNAFLAIFYTVLFPYFCLASSVSNVYFYCLCR